MAAEQAMYGLWDVWGLSWAVAALWASRADVRPRFGAEAPYSAMALAGVAVLFCFAAPMRAADGPVAPSAYARVLLQRLWSVSEVAAWTLVAATAGGLAFCWWARLHLGRLWSGFVTRKADHRIVDTGPYRLVRHPIYTGLLAAALAMALLKATAAGLVGLALLSLGIWLKARLEERFLRVQLGPKAYESYSRRTPMLIPFSARLTKG